ncbi:MAG: DUF11 domain-containing protein [Planctomycetota bacterium]|jgi:uncharacterized repeat protein (TIGR01451 family)|nr:DUF11 domain-containing protein [Planctomycetota bacterium]
MNRVLGIGLALLLVLGSITFASAEDASVALANVNYKEANNSIYSWCGYPGPCKVPTSALVLLEKQGPSEVVLGDTFSYQIQVSNRSAVDLIAVVLEDTLPVGLSVQSIEPKPDSQVGAKLVWNLGTIPAKTAKLITITGSAYQVGCLISNALAKICYELPLPLATRVVQSNIALAKTLPAQVELCDIIPLCLTVQNVGSAVAGNVKISDPLPDGLTTVDGKTEIAINVGNLAVGASKTYTVDLKATRTGQFTNTASASGDRGIISQASASVTVKQAKIALSASAPIEGYISTNIPYNIVVTNVGDIPARDVILVDAIDGNGVRVTDIAGAGRATRGRIAWALGTLQPGESRELSLVLCSDIAGTISSSFELSARCVEPKAASHCLNLTGVSGVLTSLKDSCDPVKVGDTVTYTITATNTGTKESRNLRYTIRLDEGQEFVSGEGATPVTKVDERTLTFGGLETLPIKATASWTVTVKATSQGDKRFIASLITDELTGAVRKAESTNFYEPSVGVVVIQ